MIGIDYQQASTLFQNTFSQEEQEKQEPLMWLIRLFCSNLSRNHAKILAYLLHEGLMDDQFVALMEQYQRSREQTIDPQTDPAVREAFVKRAGRRGT